MKKLILLIVFIPFFSFGQNNSPVSSNVSAATLKNTSATVHLVSTDVELDASTTYYWRVKSSDGTNASYSIVYSFKTQ